MGKRERIIEGTWNCTSCDARDIPARHARCPTCNSVREGGTESSFDFGATDAVTGRTLREGVTDAAQQAAAGKGPDWFCEYCDASNRADVVRCRTCNAARSPASRTAAVTQSWPAVPSPPPRVSPAAQAAAEAAAEARPPTKKGGRRGAGCLLVLLLGCGGFGVLGWWGQQTHAVTGEVVERSWRREVKMEHFTRVKEQGWRDELRATPARMPVDGRGELPGVSNVRDCKRAQRGTREVADGTERVCTTKSRRVRCGSEERCSRQDLGNGYAKEVCEDVPKYCSEDYRDCEDRTRYRTVPVYADRCTYDTWRWEAGVKRELRGADDPPRWPDVAVGPLDRATRTEAYQVTLAYDDGDEVRRHVVELPGEAEFARWRAGARARLDVSNLGRVADAALLP